MGVSPAFSSSQSCCFGIESGRWENTAKGWPFLSLLPDSWAVMRPLHRRLVYLSQTFTLLKKSPYFEFRCVSWNPATQTWSRFLTSCATAADVELELSVSLLSVLRKTYLFLHGGNRCTCTFRYFLEFVTDYEGYLMRSTSWCYKDFLSVGWCLLCDNYTKCTQGHTIYCSSGELRLKKKPVKFHFLWDKSLFARDAGKIQNLHIDLCSDRSERNTYFLSITFLLTAEGTRSSKRGAQTVNGSLLICPQEKRNLSTAQPFVSVTLWLVERADWFKCSAGQHNSLKMAKSSALKRHHKRNYTGKLRPF